MIVKVTYLIRMNSLDWVGRMSFSYQLVYIYYFREKLVKWEQLCSYWKINQTFQEALSSRFKSFITILCDIFYKFMIFLKTTIINIFDNKKWHVLKILWIRDNRKFEIYDSNCNRWGATTSTMGISIKICMYHKIKDHKLKLRSTFKEGSKGKPHEVHLIKF